MKKNRRIKRKVFYILTVCLILFFLLTLIIIYSHYLSPKIVSISEKNIQKKVYNSIYNSIYNNLDEENINNLFIIHQNKNEEIIYVDFDVNKSNMYLKKVVTELKKELKPVNLKVPIFVISNNPLISSLGPKINVQSKYVNSVMARVYTKITDYGLNNALVEGYIKVEVDTLLITPVSKKTNKYKYDMLISSKVINGRVPSLYGSQLLTESNLLTVPLEK